MTRLRLRFDPERLTRICADKGLNYTQLAATSGLSASSTFLYLNGGRVPMADSLAALADALGVRIDDMFYLAADDLDAA